MTDEQIIKYWNEIDSEIINEHGEEFDVYITMPVAKSTVDLINRQQAEIARLEKELTEYKLPCKVGQTVFRIVKLYGDRKPIIVEGEVFEIALTHENGEIKKRFYFLEKGGNKIINRYSLWLDFDEIGKTAFFTKEEAEKKLEGMHQ